MNPSNHKITITTNIVHNIIFRSLFVKSGPSRPGKRTALLTSQEPHAPASRQCVKDEHEDASSNHCYHRAVDIHTRLAGLPKEIREKTANDCPDDPQQAVASDAVASRIEKFAADETNDQTEKNPNRKRHQRTLLPARYEQAQRD